MSIEIGRLPALLGREFFRSRSETIREAWFEDAVIYVHDIERCLECLHHFDQQVIARVVLQDYTQEDAARLLNCTDRHLRARLATALDVLAQLFLDRNLMVIAKSKRRERAVENLPVAEESSAAADAAGEQAAIVDKMSACAASSPALARRRPWAGHLTPISTRHEWPDEAWRDLAVEFSCQAPAMSQIRANC